jgi:hypothetical protein
MPTPERPTLLPCPSPWCLSGDVGVFPTFGLRHYVFCRACMLGGPRRDTPAKAAAAWNTRHLDPATLALARLGAVCLSPTTDAADQLVEEEIARDTPGIRERVAELLETEDER